eukprot:m.372486 g.372486  ORF g.372486 m.372486 type:complete len:591 (+) comp28148_c0_seq3:361-2133(+)
MRTLGSVPRLSKPILLGAVVIVALVLLVWREPHHVGGTTSVTTGEKGVTGSVKVVHRGETSVVRFDSHSSDSSLKEAIAGALALPIGSFSLREGEVTVSISPGSLENGGEYTVHEVKPSACAGKGRSDRAVVEHQVEGSFHDVHGDHGLLKNGIVLSGRKARLPRVVITCLGTGRYRNLAIEALASARTYLGGDCLVSLHLLTDNVTGVAKEFNAAYIPYREWPLSGLRKFEDILTALETHIEEADYFYFMDGDVRFQEHVLLGDVAGDMVAVEHPMYPRHDKGWCVHGKLTMCEYPYERKKASTAYIPEEYGKFKRELRTGEKVTIANSYYLQSAFWGGKSKFIIPCLKELQRRVNVDIENGYISSIIQDERYVNWWFWKHSNDSSINIRMLKNAYLYPFRETGFGAWVVNASRPIMIHGTAKAGKMIIGEAEIKVSGGAGGKSGTCYDSFLKNKIGTYSCHDEEFRGGTQGFIWLDNKIRTSETIKLCADGTGLGANKPVRMGKCTNSTGQLWDFDSKTKRLVNRETKLCLDPMRFDKKTYPEAFRKNDWPVHMQKCGHSPHQVVEITVIDVEASAKTANKKKLLGQY